MSVGPYSQDVLTRVINVQWGGDIIVVFVDASISEAQPAAAHELMIDTIELLAVWNTPYQAAGFKPGFTSRAYRVAAAAGEFIKTTAPGGAGEFWIDALVFAMDGGDVEASVQRAVDGTKLVVPAIYLDTHSSSDIPFDMAPNGLLWLVETPAMFAGQWITWKTRFGNHRVEKDPPDDTLPPNAMAQCYPLGPPFQGPFGDISVTVLGYFIYAYRLDAGGTGTVYGELVVSEAESLQAIDPAWDQPIISGIPSLTGIQFQDPPPLVHQDLTT